MKTYNECIPCFFKQALEASRIAGADNTVQRNILNAVARHVPDFQFNASPPEMARTIYQIVSKMTGVEDPYLHLKKQCNRFALDIYNHLIDKLNLLVCVHN